MAAGAATPALPAWPADPTVTETSSDLLSPTPNKSPFYTREIITLVPVCSKILFQRYDLVYTMTNVVIVDVLVFETPCFINQFLI